MITEITIPKDTPESSPVVQVLDFGKPIIKMISVTIPDGHKYLARLSITSQGRLIAPNANDGVRYIRGNNNRVEFPISQPLEGVPYLLTFAGWNEDDTYPHTFYIEVT